MTIDVKMNWKDSRLTFANLVRGTKNWVQAETIEELWIPFDHIIYENAIIGALSKASNYEVRVKANPNISSLKRDTTHAVQDRLFSGANNTLLAIQRYRIKFTCTFYLQVFPFDR